MTAITIALDGAPAPKGRPRFGAGHRVYTPSETKQFQNSFGWAAKIAMAGRKPFQCAVRATALFELEIPNSWSKAKRADAITGAIAPTTKPDLDNFLKAALDACNRIAFIDDGQIVEISARKIYGVAPKTILTIQPIPGRAS